MNFSDKACIVFSLDQNLRKYNKKISANMCWSNTNANNKILARYNNTELSLILKYTILFKLY